LIARACSFIYQMEHLAELLMVKYHQSAIIGVPVGELVSGLMHKISSFYSAIGLEEFSTPLLRECSSHWLTAASLGCPTDLLIRQISEAVKDHYDRLSELATLLGVELSDPHKEMCKLWLLELSGKWISQMKVETVNVFNRYIGVPLSPKPSIKDFWNRNLHLRWKMFCTDRNRRSATVAAMINTAFQGLKKSLLPGLPSMVVGNLRDHAVALQKDVPREPDAINRIRTLIRQMGLRGFWSQTQESENVDLYKFGSHATCEFTRGRGGELGYRAVSTADGPVFPPGQTTVGHVRRVRYFPRLPGEDPPPDRPVVVPFELKTKEELVYDYQEDFDVLPVRPDDDFIGSLPKIRPACILEPLKVRIITKPEAGTFVRMRTLQNSLWQFLVNHPSRTFELIGQPLKRVNLWDVLMDWREGDLFHSGDFSAATDNLAGWVTETILEELLDGAEEKLRKQIVDSMINNIVELDSKAIPRDPVLDEWQERSNADVYKQYWDSVGGDLPSRYQQRNGQVMGNVLSFPILCLANYLSYHMSMEECHGRRYKPFRCPRKVKINGDDILFCASPMEIETWDRMVRRFGLNPSPGKDFSSAQFIQLNSMLWRVEKKPLSFGGCRPQLMVVDAKPVPYVNMGILVGRRKCDSRISPLIERVVSKQSLIDTKFDDDGSLECRARGLPVLHRELTQGTGDLPGLIRSRLDLLWSKHVGPLVRRFPGIHSEWSQGAEWENNQMFSRTGSSTVNPSWVQLCTKRFPELRNPLVLGSQPLKFRPSQGRKRIRELARRRTEILSFGEPSCDLTPDLLFPEEEWELV